MATTRRVINKADSKPRARSEKKLGPDKDGALESYARKAYAIKEVDGVYASFEPDGMPQYWLLLKADRIELSFRIAEIVGEVYRAFPKVLIDFYWFSVEEVGGPESVKNMLRGFSIVPRTSTGAA